MSGRQRWPLTLLAVSVLGWLGTVTARGLDSLVPDAEFDDGFFAWTNLDSGTGAMQYIFQAGHDRCLGDLRWTSTASGAGTTVELESPCLDLSGAATDTWSLGADFYFTSGQTHQGDASLRVEWFSSAECSGAPAGTDDGPAVTSTVADTWQTSRADLTEPGAGAASALVRLRLTNQSAGAGSLVVRVDGVQLRPGGGYLFAGNFEAGAPELTCRWLTRSP